MAVYQILTPDLECLLQVTRLRYTPRKFVIHPEHKTLVIAEADHAAVPLAQRQPEGDQMDTGNVQVWKPPPPTPFFLTRRLPFSLI